MGSARFMFLALLTCLITSRVSTNPLLVTPSTTAGTRVNNEDNINSTDSSSDNTTTNNVDYDNGRNISNESTISVSPTTALPPLTRCEFQFLQNPRNQLFSVGDEDLPVLDTRFMILPSQSRCYLSRSDLESRLNASHPEVVIVFGFACLNPGTDLLFLEDDEVEELLSSPRNSRQEQNATSMHGNVTDHHPRNNISSSHVFYDNYISYVQIMNCRVKMKSVNMVANMTDLRVLTILGNRGWNLAELEANPELCVAFQNLKAFSIIADWSAPEYLHHLAHCAGYLDNVVEMVFTNDSLTSFPEVLYPAVPNLRALEIINNKLTSPVDFPWPSGFAELPRNLTRTYQFNAHYNFGGSFDMQPNLFRRVFLLDHNRITNLTHFQFHSDFQYISVTSNGLREIAEDVFDNVPSVQFLSLADNDLETLPENLFARLTNLKRLDLQRNQLTSLPTKIFRNLRQLERLNLAQNYLKLVQDGLFTRLVGLTDLKLQNNSIEEVSFGAFSSLSIKLKTVELQHNPLKTFPVILLEMRGLRSANLEFTDIEVLDFVEVGRLITASRLSDALKNPTTGEIVDLKKNPAFQKVVSLRYSKLRSIVMYNATRETPTIFLLTIKHFTIFTEGSNLACDCHILNVTHRLQNWTMDGTLNGQETCLQGWQCEWPTELKGKPLRELKDEDTYCPLKEDCVGSGSGSTSSCPEGCACYMRTKVRSVIVDCQHGGLTSLPARVPANTQELWLQNNNIHTLEKLPYLAHLRSLKLTSNNVQEIPSDVLQFMVNLRDLHADDNLLTRLEPDLAHLTQLQDVRLAGNPFRCDCHTLWMKDWLLKQRNKIQDWWDIKCSTDDADGQDFTSVSDNEFICKVSASLGELAVPIAIPVTLGFIVLTCCVVAFIQRRRLKVLLYIHTGMHPFDRDPHDDRALYDVTVCCDVTARAWVLRNVIELLEEGDRYAVFFYSRDAFVGFTTSENVRHCVKNSRRLVVVLGKDWHNKDLLVTATKEGLNKCRNEMVHFMTVVIHQLATKDIDDKDIQQYIKQGRFVTTDDKHFAKKLLYEMPHIKAGKAAPKQRHPEQEKRPADGPQPIPMYDIMAAAENERNDLAERSEDQQRRNDEVGRRVSEREVQLNLKNEQNLVNPDQNTEIIHRQISEQPSLRDDYYNDDVVDNRNAENKRISDTNVERDQNFEGDQRAEEQFKDVSRNGNLRNNIALQNQLSVESETGAKLQSVFVWYEETDLPFTLKQIVQPLETRGHACTLQDRDFPLGAAIQENIVHAAETCTRTIFVLSNQTPKNEWFTYVFHVVFDRCLQSRDHRVALVMREDVDVTKFVEEIQQVIKTSALLPEDDPWFAKRLKNFVNFEGYEIC